MEDGGQREAQNVETQNQEENMNSQRVEHRSDMQTQTDDNENSQTQIESRMADMQSQIDAMISQREEEDVNVDSVGSTVVRSRVGGVIDVINGLEQDSVIDHTDILPDILSRGSIRLHDIGGTTVPTVAGMVQGTFTILSRNVESQSESSMVGVTEVLVNNGNLIQDDLKTAELNIRTNGRYG